MLLRQVETFQQCAQKLGMSTNQCSASFVLSKLKFTDSGLPLLNPLVVRECDSGGGSEHVIEVSSSNLQSRSSLCLTNSSIIGTEESHVCSGNKVQRLGLGGG